MTTEQPTRIFVYGTLRRDPSHEMFHLLAKYGRFVGDATVSGRLFDLGEYPGMVRSDTGEVVGELYEVDQANWGDVIERLDRYEGCSFDDPLPHEYRRELVNANLVGGVVLRAWAYVLSSWPAMKQEIESVILGWREGNTATGTSGLTRGSTCRGPASARRPSRLVKSKPERRHAARTARLTCRQAARRAAVATWALAAQVNL